MIDSVAALVPKAELEGEMGMATMGMQARLMSQALRKLTAILAKSKTTCIFTNQLREKVGVMFGNPETTPGGKALKFYASIRIDIRRRDTLKDAAGNAIGNAVKVKIVKNKVAPPFAEAEFEILYNHGINKEGSILDVGMAHGVVDKKGRLAAIRGRIDRPGQGRRPPGPGGQARTGPKNRRRHHGQAQRRRRAGGGSREEINAWPGETRLNNCPARAAKAELPTSVLFDNLSSCWRRPNIVLASRNTTAWRKRACCSPARASSCSTDKSLICHPLAHSTEASPNF